MSNLHAKLNDHWQLDLTHMQTQPTREKKFIIVQQDHITKFMLFHALETKHEEAAYNPNSIYY